MKLSDLVDKTIMRFKEYEKLTEGRGFYLAFSGGKDSCVIKKLAEMSGVKYDAHYNNPTIDPPELTRFIKDHHPDVVCHVPDKPFLVKLVSKGMPRRQSRWCCEFLKEGGGKDRWVLTGIRHQESFKRSKRKMLEICQLIPGKRFFHPIIDWHDRDVWMFIERFNVPYCQLYDEGFSRIGCLFCPMANANKKKMEAERYPNHKKALEKALQKLKDLRETEGNPSCKHWANGAEMFSWYTSNLSVKKWRTREGDPFAD